MKLTIAIFVAVLCGLLSLSAHGSVFYKFQIIAHTGQAGLTGIGSGVSINDKGTVAFVGTLAGGDNIFTGNGSLLKKVRSVESPAVTFGQNVQISNTGQIVARDTVAATSVSPVRTRVRIWDSNTTDANTIIARGSLGEDFDATIANALSINNKDLVVFAARTGVNNFLVTHPSTGGFLRSNPLTIPLRPALADDGRIVVRGGAAATDPILLYEYHLSSVGAEVVAQVPGSFTSLGRSPGISDDGSVVAFAGDRGNGPGVFVRLLESGGLGKGFIVAGEPLVPSAEIGYDNTSPPSPINITSVDFDQRVGVARVELGAPGFEDDVLYVTFVGTPSGASRDNPQLPGVPLVFSAGKGVWTIRIDLDAPLDGSGGFAIHLNSPLPVVQVGDRIPTMSGVCQVSDLAIYDPVAVAAYDDDGAVIRTQRRGDHRVAFWASCASGGAVVVRASHLDSDQDGLLDHWEEAGGGIDVDQDGIIDLDLSAFGATPGARDLFLELDWLSPRVTGSVLPYLLEPPPGSTQFLANMFAAAPALIGPRYGNRSDGLPPDDIPLGITAHIDAGTKTDALGHPFSQNIPPGSPALGGGTP